MPPEIFDPSGHKANMSFCKSVGSKKAEKRNQHMTIRIRTVGDLQKAIANIPIDTKVVRITNGYWCVKKDDVSVSYKECLDDSSLMNKEDEFFGKVLIIGM